MNGKRLANNCCTFDLLFTSILFSTIIILTLIQTKTASPILTTDSRSYLDINANANDPWTFCNLVPMTGQCRAFIPMWFFNMTTATCDQFIYGGCKGNRNRFEGINECMAVCGPAMAPYFNAVAQSASASNSPTLRNFSGRMNSFK